MIFPREPKGNSKLVEHLQVLNRAIKKMNPVKSTGTLTSTTTGGTMIKAFKRSASNPQTITQQLPVWL